MDTVNFIDMVCTRMGLSMDIRKDVHEFHEVRGLWNLFSRSLT